ncbi:MAG: APC family permease [Vicinamibacterales bacterium]
MGESAESRVAIAPSLARTLSLRDLVVYGLLFIGPLAPVGIFGVLDARTDGAVATVYVLATIAMSFTAWSYAEMSRVVPRAGSIFAYASEALGHRVGFIAGWMAMLDYLLIPSVAYLFSGIALHTLVPTIPVWAFTVTAFAITTLLNAGGVAVAARAGLVIVVAEIGVLLIFLVYAGIALGEHGAARGAWTPFTAVDGFTMASVVGAVSIAVLSFLGFDAIASFAEETAGDSRVVGRAIVICLATAGVLFVAQTYLAAVLNPTLPGELAEHPERQGAAFYDFTRSAVGAWMATLLAITKAIGPAFAAMTAQAAAARLLFGMAREGRLPRALARIDPRRSVPLVALLAAGALTVIVAIWAAQRSDGLDVLVSIVDLGALAAFTLLHASVVGYFVWQRKARTRSLHIVVPVLGAIVTVWVIAEASSLAKTVAAVWLVAGLLVSAFTRPSAR